MQKQTFLIPDDWAEQLQASLAPGESPTDFWREAGRAEIARRQPKAKLSQPAKRGRPRETAQAD